MRIVQATALLALWALAACSQRQVPVATLPPPPAKPERALVETPAPASVPGPPLPALKPGTDLSLNESEAVAEQSSPKGPPVDVTPIEGQAPQEASAGAPAGAVGPSVPDIGHLVGLSQSDASKAFGEPVERKDLPPSQVWTYHSDQCDLRLFFYPEVGGSAFRALTYEIDDRGSNDANHVTCLASLAKPHAG